MKTVTIIEMVVLVFALAAVPDKCRPAWINRLSWWQVVIGLAATVAAFVIVMNPEFYALGLLGDSAFFDFLVLALGIQFQMLLSRMGVSIAAGSGRVVRIIRWRYCVVSAVLAVAFEDLASTIQKRFWS